MLLLGAIGVAAIAIPRLVQTPEFSAALAQRAGRALGTPVAWERLDVGLFPPRVILVRPTLVGTNVTGDALDERSAGVGADAIELHLSLWPLLQRRIAIESLLVRGLALTAARTADGLVLPDVVERLSHRESAAAPSEDASADSAFHVDLRALRVEDSSFALVDHTLSPPASFRLDALNLAARGRSLDEPLDVEGQARLLANDRALGAVAARGHLALAGDYDVDVELDRLAAPELQPFLPSDVELGAGTVSGRISLAGRGGTGADDGGSGGQAGAAKAGKRAVDLVLAGFAAKVQGIALSGDLSLRADQRGDGRIPFEATYRPAGSGKAELRGELARSGALELTTLLEAFELAPFAPLLGPDRAIEGRATGEISLALEPAAEPSAEPGSASRVARRLSRVVSDLVIDGARYADGRIDAKGRLDFGAAVDGPGGSAPVRIQAVFEPEQGGRIDLNATGALAGALEAAIRFDAVDAALFAPLLPEATSASGKLSGEVELETTSERAVAKLASRLRIAGAHVVRAPVDVSGDLSLDARTTGSGPIELSARATLADGGRVGASGTATRDGVVDLALELERFALAALVPFVDRKDLALAGRVDGRGTLVGPYADLERLVLDLAFAETQIRVGGLEVSGPFAAKLDFAKPLSDARRGSLDLDLDDARLRQAETFAKPAGVRARFASKIEPGPGGELLFETHGALHDVSTLDLTGSLGEKRSTYSLTTSEFELAGWSDLLPALAPHSPKGVVSFSDFSRTSAEGEKDRFEGRVNLRGVEVTLSGAGRVRFDGALAGAGERVELDALRATLHGLVTRLTGSVRDPLGEARFELAAQSEGDADANPFVSGLSSLRDVLYGALVLDASLAGVAGGDAKLTDTLSGRVRFSVGERGGGRLRGLSILQATLGQIPLLGGAAQIAARLRDPADASNDLAERFEIIEGDLAADHGQIEARTLRLRYRGHEARVSGRMQLEGLELDMTGELLLDPPLVARLTGRPESELAGRGPVRIPLARITNTLSSPKVSLAPETLAAVPRLLMLTTGAGAIVDDAVGKAVGKTVGKVEKRIGDALGKIGRSVGGGDSQPGVPPASAPAPTGQGGPPSSTNGPDVPSPSPPPAPPPSGSSAEPRAPTPESGTAIPSEPSSGPTEPSSAPVGDPADTLPAEGSPSPNAPSEPAGNP